MTQNSVSKKTLALFFTVDASLKTWEENGNLIREIAPYKLLARRFRAIYFFTYGLNDDKKIAADLPPNVKIIPQKINLPSFIYSFLFPFIRKKELQDADILKTNQLKGAWSAAIAKLLYGKKLVVRGGYEWLSFAVSQKKPFWKRWIIYRLEKFVYRIADKIILASSSDKEFVEKTFSVPTGKITIIPNYIDVDIFRPINVPKEANRIIFVGRLEEQKNIFNLLKAIAGPEIKLVIFGGGSLRKELEKSSKKLGVNVEFKGNIPNDRLPEELNRSEIFVLPSYFEGNPKTLLEAMSCGLPCIGTNVPGVRELIKHKENGYLCETSSDSIRKAIQEVMADQNLRQKIGRNARQTIVNNFSLEKNLEKEMAIYQTL